MDIMNEACYDCNSRSTMAYGDVRLGDYWGEKYDTNTKGVSAVVLKTKRGVEIFNAVKGKLKVENAALEHILIGQSYGKLHKYNNGRRDFLLQNLSESLDLQHVYKEYMKMFPLKTRIKKQLKSIVKLCPKSIYFPIKKLMHSI